MLKRTWECRYLFEMVISSSLDYIPRSWIIGFIWSFLFLVFEELHAHFHNGCMLYIPTKSAPGFPFLFISCLFDKRYEVIFYSGFDLHFQQQCRRVLFSPYPHHYLFVFLILAILTDVVISQGFDLHAPDD